MPDNVDKLFEIMQANGAANDRNKFRKVFLTPGNKGYKIRKDIYDGLRADGIIDSPTYEDFRRKLRLGGTPTVNKYRQQLFNSVDPTKNKASELTRKAVKTAHKAMDNVRKPVTAKYVNKEGKPTGGEFAITPAKTVEDLNREYAQEVTKNWENELHDQMADADKDAAKISDMFKSFIGSTDEVGSVWGNMTRGGGISGVPHSVTTNNGILENTETRQLLAASDYNRKRKELLQLEQDSRNGAIFDDHSFFRGMYDAAKDTGLLTGGASDLINAGSLLSTKQDLDNGVHTEAGDMLLQQAVKNSNAQGQYGDNQGWMYTGGVITANMAPFMVQIASAGFSKGMSTSIGKVVQGVASKAALGTMKKAAGFASADFAKNIGKFTGLTTKAFGKAIQYGIVGAAQANTVGLGNVANDVMNRYTGQVYQDEQGNYKFGTFDSDGNLVHEGGEDFLTALAKGDAAQTIEFATELAGGGIDAVGTALKNFVKKGGKEIIKKYNMENVSKVIDFLLNNNVSKNVRYLKAGADRTLGKVELNSIVGESLEEELGIIANTVFTGDNKISDLWDEKQQSQIWGGMLLSIGLMKGAVVPFHAYNAKQYYSYKHKLNKADANLSQLLGNEKWEELRDQIDATTNKDMPDMINKINRDVALGKNRQPVREYIQNLIIMRGYDIGNMLAAKKAVEDKGEGVSVKNMEKNQAYQQGRDAYGYDTHEIQLDQEYKQKSLAQLLGISEQQLSGMSDDELESMTGQDDKLDRAIYDYQLSSARYEGVVDNARDQIDLEVQRAAQAVDMYTDKSRNTIRNATIKATGGLEDYGVYIINGNIATHDDGSIDISNSDDMILYYDPTTNKVEHADAMMFAELGSEENADEVRSQAMADAKEKAIKETTGIIDGVVEVGTQFKTTDADGTEHTYEVLADNGDGTAMITIDGNIPTEIVKGENVQVPVSFEELQKMKDDSDQQRLQAAKAQREQMEEERAEQQNQSQTIQTENPAQESNTQSAPIEDNLDYSDIIREDGKVQMVDVSDKDGNNLFPDAKDVFYIQGNKMRTKFAYIDANGELKTQSFPTGLVKIKTRGEVSVDDYKKYRNTILAAESPAMPESSMKEGNSGENRGGIEAEPTTIEDETTPDVAENTETTAPADETAETPSTEQAPAAPAITLEDGTIVPMLEDGNPDFSKLTAEQTAELYDTQFGDDADSVISSWVSEAKKALDKANNMTVKGKSFVEQKAAKDAKEKAIADAQTAYDSAIAIRDAYNNRQLAKAEGTPEGRRNLVDKARRKFARLKSSVKDDAEAVARLYRDTVGSILHSLYDGTGIDVTDTVPLTAEEYVASNLGAHSLNYEGNETSKGVKQETGLSREDFAKTQLLAADGKGTTIDALVHSLWDNRPSNLESLDTQDIRNALIDVLTSGFKASEARSYIENIRIAQAEKLLEEQKLAAENAAYHEQQKAKEEEEKKKAEEEENEKTNEQTNENINAPENIEVPEDATDENPFGLQLSEDKVPFEIKGEKSGDTYDINDKEDRKRLVAENSVDDKDILDIDMPEHVHKAIKELCKKMGLKVQFLYMGARLNGWIENGTMYLALDANKATQFVFGHEMTHAIKQKNPEAYKELVKVAMAVTTKKEFEEDLAKVYRIYHNASGYNNIGDFVEEVIADNIGKFINDHDLAQRFVLRLNHPVLATILHAIQKIKGLLYGDFYKSADALERIIEQAYVKTANGQVSNSETGEDVSFSLRQKPEPKKKGIGYKVFVLKDGKLYPPMVANPDGAATPVGVWLDADAAPIAGESKTGRPQVKQGGKGTQGGSGKLAYRPGWHLGVVPYAIQFNRKDADGNKTLFPKNFVFAEVEYAADVDYQEEARQEGINPSGKYQHSLAGLKHLPTDGYYMYRTNPNPETDPWVITGAMKVNRILTRAEQAELVKNAGREPQQIQEGDIVTDDVVNSINQEIANAPKFSLKVYHGSGADFTEFDFDHMGEGAGSQAFGWGGYVTSSEEIGKSYATMMDNDPSKAYYRIQRSNGTRFAKKYPTLESFLHGDKQIAMNDKFTEQEKIDFYNEMKKLAEPYHNLYEVDIPEDNGGNYLDWDAPITDELIDKVAKALPSLRSYDIKDLKKDRTFDNFYKTISMRSVKDDASFNDDKAASKLLSSLGYTGIKYKAGRNFGGAEVGDTNYVIFKPEDMRITEHTKFSLKDNQGNPLNQDGTLKLDKIKSVDELTDEDFTSAFRNVELPAIPKNVDAAIGANGKPVVIKKNIFEKNWNTHKFTPAESKKVLNDALYNTDLVGHTQPTKKPNHWVAIKLDDKSPITVLEVNDNKDNVEVVGWYTLDERNLGRIKRQAERNGGELIMLTPKDDKVESLSTPPLSSAAKIDNYSETAKENGEKFSLKDEKTMFGMHNISVDKLRKAIKQGGFAAPSMGVVDSKNGIYSDYGEITLIPKAEKLAKRTGKNAGTFTADAWTPTYPQVERIMNKQGEKAFNTDMNVKLGDVDNGIYSNVRESWKGYLSSGDVRDGLYWHYLFDKGMNPETIYQTGKYDNDITNEVMRISDNGNKTDYTDKEVAELIQLMNKATGKDNDVDAQREKLKARIASAEKQGNHLLVALKKKRLEELEGVENFYIAADFVNDVVRNNRKNGKLDVHDTMGSAKKKVEDNKKLSDDFPSWLDKKTEEYGVEEMLYNGTTPSGKPKYIPNTIDNAVKLMKKQGVAGGYTAFGSELGVFIAKNSPEVNTLAAMKNAKDKLIPFGDERHNQIKDKITKEFLELSDEIRVGFDNRFAFDDSGVSRMVELTDHKGNEREYLKKAYNAEVSDEWMDRYNKLLDTIKKDYKVFYFETKFMRPYGLDEFEKAIVPSDTPSDVVDALKKAGIDVSSYERGNAEDRQKVTMDAINSSDNIRFSLKSMMAKPEGWKQANKKAIHIAEAIERDPRFSLKKLDGTLIKAGTYFSGGGLVEEGLKGIIDPVVAVEYDEKISGVYRNNFGQHIVTADVRDVDPKELVKQIDGEVEYFHASPVCKNYSQAKSNHAEVELDKETAASTADFINAVKPKVVTIENVKGYKDSDAMKTITDALDANGYTWDADVYNAADYGGYTNRERLIVRAVRNGKLPEKPKKMEHKSGWYEAVADIIPTLTEKKNGVAPWMDVRLKADGIDWRNIDKPLYVMGSAYADRKIPHAFADELLPTLRTKSGDVIVMPDGKVYRAMGRVLARVSGVSDDYKMPFSESLSHTIIGNGIPTQLTEHVIAPLVQNTLRPTSPEEGNTKFAIRQFGTDIADASDKIKNLMNNEKIISRRIGSRAQAQSRVLETISRASDEFRRSNRASAKSGQDTWEKDRALGYVIRASYGTGSFLTEEEIKEITSGKVGNGQENQVYLSKDGKTVIKLNNLLMVDREFRFNEFLDRIKAHNEFVPDDMYTPLGFALNEDGDFCLVLEQPYVKGEPATQEEIDDYMESHGYDLYPVRVSADEVGAGWSNGEFEIWDTKPRNVLKDKNGDLHFIDTVIQHAFIDGHNDKLRLSLRGSTPYDKQMEEWKEKNHLEKGAVPMEKPVMEEGENIFDYANRMVEWTRNQNLWKTAPKQTGFQDALDKWKADNGLSPDAYPPVRPHRENYSTEIGYTEDLEEYNKKKELWKSAPKPKDFDLSVDLEDMNKQLRNIRRAVLNQKNYDQRTVKAVSDLVRKMLNIGWGDGLSRGKVGNLLSAAKNATGANDVKKYLDKAMGILAENYLNRLSTAYDNLINTKGARADQSGVIKMGSLDAKGQAFMSEYKKAINMDDSSLNTYIANIEEDSAKNEDNVEMNDYRLAGIQAAIIFKQQIGGNDADIAELQRQIGELKNKKDATKEDKDLLKSLEKKLFENKFDRITMYENLLNNIQRMVKESKGRAKEFREEITEHKNEILHRANLDLEGVDSTYYDTTTAKKKFVNNVFQRAAFSSTYTFEQFLKFFGKKATNGEGYLYNYFTKLNQDALDEEQLYNEMNRNALDEKTKELFGKKKFMKLVGIDGNGMKEMDIEVTDYSNKNTGKRTIHLKQGQMLYIYLVNKETDGEMKLRAMGITEEDVAAIEENLDPRVKAMGEWLQDEYLPECQRRYQATHTKYFGAPMKEVENYFPLAINNRARNVKEDVNQDTDAMSQLAGTSTGAIVTRRVNVIPLDIENVDAFEVAFNHLQEMEEWSAMLPFRQDINTLLSYTHFRNQVQNMSSVAYGSGKTLWDEFKQTAQIAAGTYKPKVNAGMMDSRIAAAMGGVAVAKISGRLWTAIKQSQSATVFLPECDFTRFVKNGINPYGSWKWAKENIPDFRKRIENITYGDVKLRQYLDELEKYHDWTKVISKLGMAPNILVDGITCAVGARSVYETEVNRLTKLGYPKEKAEEKAYYKAVAAYNKTQQSSGGMYLSPMQVDRTYVSAALSLFKNANFAYGRMQIEACRGLARTYDFWGGKHKTALIESMTRQIMEEDGLDENTARSIAKATYNRTFRQSIGRLINFATLVPVSWALYKVLPYLLTGDDDDKKKDMIEEAVLKGFATSLSDNYVIPFASNILDAGLKVEDGKPTFDPEVFRYQNLYINPATSDLANIYSMIGNQKWYSVANKLGMLGVQSLIGFNPETVGSLYQAFAEADKDNGNTAKEWQIGILKAISAPEESIRELYMDELGLKNNDTKKIPLAELEKRYAERQINRDNLLSQIGMDAETFNGYIDKYQKSFEKKIKDKMDKWDEYDKKKVDEFFDTTTDPKLKDMIAKKRVKDANAAADEQIAKEGLSKEKKGKEPYETAYDAVKMSIDVAEDNAISTYNKVLNKRYAAMNDEYNEQTDAMKIIFMSKHPFFKAYKDLESEYTTYGKKMKELKEKLVSVDGYDAKQTILKQIRAERDKFSKLQSKVR